MTVTENIQNTSSCDSGSTTLDEDKPLEAAALVGALYAVSGLLLSHIPPMRGADILTLDGNPVRIAVLASGKLQLTSLISANNKVESIKNARHAHSNELREVRENLERITAIKNVAEEQYGSALEDEDSMVGEELGLALLKLVAQEKGAARKLEKLESTDELKVTFATQGGMTASLQPGVVTVVPFATTPMVWCPKSLAKAKPLDDTASVVTVPSVPTLILKTPSQILSAELLTDLFRMLPATKKNADTVQVLRKLHDQTAGMSADSFDEVVLPHANVLIVIQSSTGQVFGSFYVNPMGSGGDWTAGNEDDFLFSLGNKNQQERVPLKLLKPKPFYDDTAMSCGCGLHMGECGDLVAFCSHSTGVPATYTVPAEGYPSLLPGESIGGTPGVFTPTNMEVYELKQQH